MTPLAPPQLQFETLIPPFFNQPPKHPLPPRIPILPPLHPDARTLPPTTMYYKPNRLIDVPSTDLLTWLFGNEAIHDPDRPVTKPRKIPPPHAHADLIVWQLYVDALDPTRRLTFSQARTAIRSMIKGLHSLGIEKGSCVCLHSFNVIPSRAPASINLC